MSDYLKEGKEYTVEELLVTIETMDKAILRLTEELKEQRDNTYYYKKKAEESDSLRHKVNVLSNAINEITKAL